jgi:5'-nucleotidase
MIILTNDDGIGAPGILALEQAVNQALHRQPELGQAIAVVAPSTQQSGCGHQVTTATPIGLTQQSEHAWAIGGTPADCTRVALWHLYPQTQWVLSGINAGGNMGSDVYISGTIAAVREAALHRIPAIAFSHYRNGKQAYDWERAATWTTQLLLDLMSRPYVPGTYWNINLPHLMPDAPDPAIVFCAPCTKPLPVVFQLENEELIYCAKYRDRQRDPHADVETCLSGNIAVTQLCI